jgi:D-alanine--poly(phosphoribitol) ligase subunit 1
MTRTDRNMLLQLILRIAAEYPQRPSMIIDGEPRSYQWLLGRSAGIASRLSTLAAPGDRCAVLGRRSALSYAAFLGVLGAGQVYVPLSPHDPAPRQAEKLIQSDVRSLIVDTASLAQLAPILSRMEQPPLVLAADSTPEQIAAAKLPGGVKTLCADDFATDGDFASAICPREGSDPAYLLFTSGSTGRPKGVVVPISAVRDYVVAMRSLLRTHPEDRFSQGFDPAFDLGIHDLLVCWASGAALVPLPEFKLRYLEDVRSQGITVWFSIPSSIALAEKTGQLKPGRLSTLRLSLFCGEALMAQDARAWQRAAPDSRILNLYGPTEATIAVSTFDATNSTDPEPVVAIGRTFGGNAFHLLDPDTGKITQADEGELAIAGVQLATGYWQEPGLTAQRFPTVDDPNGQPIRVYRTGDRARREGDNYRFMGRLDNELKIHGYRINPLEVEASLAKVAEPALAAVVARTPGKLSPIDLVGFVSRSELASDEILRRCKDILPNYMWPAQIHQIDEFPRLPNGKVDRRTLAAMARDI